VLDVGCNTGLNLRALDGRWQKFGVELSATLARTAREFARAEVFCGPIEDYPEKSDRFDVVMAHAVIEHVFDPFAFVQRLSALTNDGGLVVLMTGDRESEAARGLGPRWPLAISEDHVSFFSARAVRRLAQRAGLSVERQEWRFMHTPHTPPGRCRRLLEKVREAFTSNDDPRNDLYYLYARKSQ
jgi:SAM-dependent methyltransferase